MEVKGEKQPCSCEGEIWGRGEGKDRITAAFSVSSGEIWSSLG